MLFCSRSVPNFHKFELSLSGGGSSSQEVLDQRFYESKRNLNPLLNIAFLRQRWSMHRQNWSFHSIRQKYS